MHGSTATGASGAWFQPTRGRLLGAVALAVAAFLLPQAVPLEWHPLNDPGPDILYLEITCAASVPGEVQIFYNLTRGINELDSIRWPVPATTQAFTYTFPLPDAPIVELRLDPLPKGGHLSIRQMRIINRRGEEVRRFTRDLFRAEHEIAAIDPSPAGWTLVSTANATDPYTRVELFSPIIPRGLDHRNRLRCLFSTGYLALMLWILLLAVLFAFHRPRSWRELLPPLGFMACLAGLFAVVGNRGLIRNSVQSARFVAPRLESGLRLEFDVAASRPSTAQLTLDTGAELASSDRISRDYEKHPGLQVLRFPLPYHAVRALHFGPGTGAGRLEVRGIRVVDAGQRTRAILPSDALTATPDVAVLTRSADGMTVETRAGVAGPTLDFTPEATAVVNRAIAAGQTDH